MDSTQPWKKSLPNQLRTTQKFPLKSADLTATDWPDADSPCEGATASATLLPLPLGARGQGWLAPPGRVRLDTRVANPPPSRPRAFGREGCGQKSAHARARTVPLLPMQSTRTENSTLVQCACSNQATCTDRGNYRWWRSQPRWCGSLRLQQRRSAGGSAALPSAGAGRGYGGGHLRPVQRQRRLGHPPPPPLWAAIDDGEGWQRTARSRRDGARHLPRTPAPDLTRVSALTSGPPTSQPTPTMASRSARTVLNHLTIASQELSAYSAFALVGSIDSVLYQGVCEVL